MRSERISFLSGNIPDDKVAGYKNEMITYKARKNKSFLIHFKTTLVKVLSLI